MGRFIGVRHRVKKTAEGEARPTMLAIKDGATVTTLTFDDDTSELDFVLGRFPISYRPLAEEEEVKSFFPHHIKVSKRDDSEIVRVPDKFDGLNAGDIVAMILGGSGDRFAFALSRRAEEISAKVLRITPFIFKEQRNGTDKEDDHLTLANLAANKPDLFYSVDPRDRDLIMVRETYRARQDVQKARKGCEQRLRQRFIGQVFLSPDGKYPEGAIEDAFDKEKANDVTLSNLVREEVRREVELKNAVHRLQIWNELLVSVEGCGEIIAAGIITAIGDIRRFETDAKLKAYCGVHVLPDGRFPRRRTGAVANWQNEARQALYQLSDQFVRRPNSFWGLKYRKYKANLRERHPEAVVSENGKKRFTDGHIHKTAKWRAISRFVEWLHREWTRLEARQLAESK